MTHLIFIAGFSCDLSHISLIAWQMGQLLVTLLIFAVSVALARRCKLSGAKALVVTIGVVLATAMYFGWGFSEWGCSGLLEGILWNLTN